jgi:predicted Zn-dependent protease
MKEAADALASALGVGDRSNSVYRDYADVLLRLGDHEAARKMIEVVLKRDPDNVFILDLVARIEIEGTDRRAAESALKDLERSDVDGRFIHHRRATFYQKAGEPERALPEAELAISAEIRRSPFEAQAVLADILVELGQFERFAEVIAELDSRYRNSRHDVRVGLRCKALTRQGRWREAYSVWDSLQEKELPVHRALLAGILEIKAKDSSLLLAERTEAESEMQRLRSELAETRVFFIEDDIEEGLETDDDLPVVAGAERAS